MFTLFWSVQYKKKPLGSTLSVTGVTVVESCKHRETNRKFKDCIRLQPDRDWFNSNDKIMKKLCHPHSFLWNTFKEFNLMSRLIFFFKGWAKGLTGVCIGVYDRHISWYHKILESIMFSYAILGNAIIASFTVLEK